MPTLRLSVLSGKSKPFPPPALRLRLAFAIPILVIVSIRAKIAGGETGGFKLQNIENNPKDLLLFQAGNCLFYGLPRCHSRPDHDDDPIDQFPQDLGLSGGKKRSRIENDIPV